MQVRAAEDWNQQNDRLLAEKGGFTLIVHLHTVGGYARFVVLDHRKRRVPCDLLVGSGTREDARAAKQAAEDMAIRVAMIHPRGRRFGT